MTLESIEKLRTAARNMAKGRNLEHHEDCNLLLIIADEIEREISEKYLELPVDADGVPIHVGDCMSSVGGSIYGKVTGISACVYIDGELVNGIQLSHVKSRTVEDVLRDFGVNAAHDLNADPDATIRESTIAKYASELRMRDEK